MKLLLVDVPKKGLPRRAEYPHHPGGRYEVETGVSLAGRAEVLGPGGALIPS